MPREEVQVLTIRVPKDVHEAVRTLAFATDSSINDVALRAIRDHLATGGHRKAVEGLGARVIEQYAVALDKLADL
jgi:hypothetical protein